MTTTIGCELCDYKGYIQVNTIDYQTCICVKNADIIKRYKKAYIPHRLLRHSLDDWNLKQNVMGEDLSPNQTKIKEAAFSILKKVYDNPKFPFVTAKANDILNISSMIFAGNKNSGKSLCLSLLAKKAIENGASVRFYDWFDLCTALDRYDNKEELVDIAYEFTNCNLVCVDGVEKIDLNNQAKNQLSKLFKIRSNQESWTLVSSTETAMSEMIFNSWKDFVSGSKIIKLA